MWPNLAPDTFLPILVANATLYPQDPSDKNKSYLMKQVPTQVFEKINYFLRYIDTLNLNDKINSAKIYES